VAVIRPQSDFDLLDTNLLGLSTRLSYSFAPRTDILVHLGGDYMRRDVDGTTRFLQRPESNLAPQFADTGSIRADSIDTAIAELALVRGPWSFQSEGAATWVNRSDSGLERLLFWGGYGFVSYMITGEARPYLKSRGNFGRLRPSAPFFGPGSGRGRGALEAAFRVSYLDLDDRDVRGGRLLDLTWAFNWYATRNARLYSNVVWADPSRSAKSVWIAQVRLQWAY
jgi:phosphate-selective porin OprO/OprP